MIRVRGLELLMAAGLVSCVAPAAMAFTMGEAVTVTGVQNSLAQTGVSRTAKTLGNVRSSLDAAAATKQAQLSGAGWTGGGGGNGSSWVTAGSGGGSGWALATASGGTWSATGSGWTAGGNGGPSGWSSGAWK